LAPDVPFRADLVRLINVHTFPATGKAEHRPEAIAAARSERRVVSSRDADFSAWFDQILPSVLRLTRGAAASAAEAEDIASEALARAYADWPKIRDLPHRDGWVLRTAANLSIDIARHHARSPWRRLGVFNRGEAPSRQSVEEVVANRMTVTAALSRLPRRQREALALRYLGDFSIAETAELMGLGTETVRTHLARGLAAMRSALGTSIEEDLNACD
jgi:RNA polymerase sigma factor (sigma-70 family)